MKENTTKTTLLIELPKIEVKSVTINHPDPNPEKYQKYHGGYTWVG